jgi:N-formylglutamate amidohydrolase
MTTLPIGLSLPHAGLDVPTEVRALSKLSDDEIRKDSDEGSRDIAMVLRPFILG